MLADYHESGQSCFENLKKKKKKKKAHIKLNMAHLQFDMLQIYAT